MHAIRHGTFFVGFHGDAELDGLGVFFGVVVGFGGDVPVAPAVEVFVRG
jgi:hypothetical protein